MKGNRALIILSKTIHWLLLAVVLVYVISGFGISQFRVVETITFGLLTKTLAFRIHDYLWIPFIILLVLHILVFYVFKARKKSASGQSDLS